MRIHKPKTTVKVRWLSLRRVKTTKITRAKTKSSLRIKLGRTKARIKGKLARTKHRLSEW